MAEQTFRSPGFFENEIDLSAREEGTVGTPAGIIGTSEYGPAFVPITVGSFNEFTTRFGDLDPERFGPYAVREFLKHRSAVTYMRVLGAGSNTTDAHIASFDSAGVVNAAGFSITPNSTAGAKDAKARQMGCVQFLCATHTVPAASDIGFPVFTDNDSFPGVRDLGAQASMTLTFSGVPGDNGTLKLITTNGDTITFKAGGGNAYTETPPVFARGGSAAAGAVSCAAAINSAVAGFGGSIIATVSGAVVTLTQKIPGSAGNTAVTLSGLTNVAKSGAFTGGTDVTTAASDTVSLVRAMLMTTTGSQILIQNSAQALGANPPRDNVADDIATPTGEGKRFNIIVYSSTNPGATGDTGDRTFGTAEGKDGYRVYTASLDVEDPFYIGKVLNTDPELFQQENHLLYLDFAVEDSLASVVADSASVALVSGSSGTVSSISANNSFLEVYGRFDTRYTTPRTTAFISQPYGSAEFDLFHFETITDGAYANDKFKVSIADLKASNDPNYEYGTFEVQVRKFDDEDTGPAMLERFPGCSLDPNHERYIAKVIGDMKVRYDFDSALEDERRLVISGKYPNKSKFVRVQMSVLMQNGEVPDSALPFGFRGIPCLSTSPHDKDPNSLNGQTLASQGTIKLGCVGATNLTGSILPPLPFRFKASKGAVASTPRWIGEPGVKEIAEPRFYWGVKFDRVKSGSSNVYNANVAGGKNHLVKAYTKMQGISKIGTYVSNPDTFNNHKFTLARVALRQQLTTAGEIDTNSALTGSANEHMREAAYIRNGVVDPKTYTIKDKLAKYDRLTLASLINSSSLLFNRFSAFTKFTNVFYGGFDGLNILDSDNALMNDKAASTENSYGGKAGDSIDGGLGLSGTNNASMSGAGKNNNCVFSYRKAIEIMTDPMTVRHNILAIPGIRDPYVTDFAASKNKDYQMSIYLMDIPAYDEDTNRLFIDSSVEPSATKTAEEFERRIVDNNYSATYFPDVAIEDPVNGGRRVFVPASVAAIGALAYNDNVGFPWFAPAGFNRGSLGFVKNVKSRLTSNDRDVLYDARINPIATFPDGGFVIFGQKTLQMAQTALDRVNVRRMLLELKRQINGIAERLLFEMNNAATRSRFINLATPRLALIQSQAGIESFRVVMDDTNNTPRDVEENRLNGKIVVVPTRTIEFIAIDFIITNSGVSFEHH